MNKIILLILALLPVQIIFAQGLIINGNIAMDESSTEGAKIVIYKNNNKIDEQIITKKGKFNLKLAFDGDFKISFEKDGYITKTVSINTEVPSEILNTRPDFPPVRIIINLLPIVEEVDLSIFDQPVAILSYNYELDDFTFDKEYSDSIRDKIAKTEREVRRIIETKGAAALEKERLFAEFKTKGDNGFNQKQWKTAIDNWQQALAVKPENKELPEKIDNAKKELEREQAAQAIAAQNAKAYQLLITEADNLFNQKQYADARERYSNAVKLNNTDPYPTQKISEIDALVDGLAKQKALTENYTRLIAEADQLFNQKNYNGAEPKYKEALALNYQKEYPAQRLQQITDLRKQENDRLKQEADINATYSKIITNADNSLNTKDYANAILYYNQAIEVKPAEVYPKEMLAKAEKSLTLLKKQQEEEAERKRQEEARRSEVMAKYNQIIIDADNYFKAENYAQAKLKYTDADNLNTGEIYPKNKLQEIGNIINSVKYQNRLAEYNKNKTAGDKAMETKSYAPAKVYYLRALEFLPIDKDVISQRLAEIDKMIEQERQDAMMKEYTEHIAKADKAYKDKAYAVAKFYYQKALTTKKDDKYASDQLNEVEKYISERTEKTVEL